MTGTEDKCKGCGHTYQRLPHAKSGLCCGCRRVKLTSAAKRRPSAEPGAFDSQEALDAWHAADALRCHVCGESFPGLYRHVGLAHGISTRDYKQRFGIPITYGLSGAATREKQRASGAATADKMRAGGFGNLAKGRAAKTGARTAWVPYQAREHAVRMVESPGHPSNYEGETEVTCTGCGNGFLMPANIALSFQCRARCHSCAP